MNLPNIKIGKSKRDRAKFNLTHDVNTTADFGFVQPLMCRELVPLTKMDVSVDSFVRLAPMPYPTFGRVSYRTYHQFVPIADLFRPFESLLSGKKYSGTNGAYIPSKVPHIRMSSLTKLILAGNATFTIYKGKYDTDSTTKFRMVSNSTPVATDSDISAALDVVNAQFRVGVTNPYTSLSTTYNTTTMIREGYMSVKNISLDEADFVFMCSSSASPTSTTDIYTVAFKLTKNGRHLRKILVGCGYQLSLDTTEKVSFLPICAYYKAWFDIFAPQQETTWDNTLCYSILNNMANISINIDMDYVLTLNSATTVLQNIVGFINNDLTACYYYGDNNYLSAHITTPDINQATANLGGENFTGLSNGAAASQATNSQPTTAAQGGLLTQVLLNILKKMYTWANKNTVIGGRIAEYMKAHFGADYHEDMESYYIGSDVVSCLIGDVMSTSDTVQGSGSDTTGANIGEYAGKGIGYANGDTVKFTSDTFGYWITLAVIVPTSGFFQGLDPNLKHLGRFEFYNPEFDAMGYLISTKNLAQASSGVFAKFGSNESTKTDGSFGYIPRYSEQKVAQNVVNGDLSRRGTKSDLLPYVLDYDVIENKCYGTLNTSGDGYSKITFRDDLMSDLPIGDPVWRSIGQYPYLGSFDRIFYNNGTYSENAVNQALQDTWYPLDDNFIVHNVLNVHMFAPMKPISESFNTEGEADNVMAVEKA